MAVERIIGVDFGTSTSVIRVKRYENGTCVGEQLETRDVVFNNTPITPTLVLRKNEDPSVCYFGYEAQGPKKKFIGHHSFKMDLESSDPEAQALAQRSCAGSSGSRSLWTLRRKLPPCRKKPRRRSFPGNGPLF